MRLKIKQPTERDFQGELIKSILIRYPGSRVRQAQDVATWNKRANTGTGYPDFNLVLHIQVPNPGGVETFTTQKINEYWEVKKKKLPKTERGLRGFLVLKRADFLRRNERTGEYLDDQIQWLQDLVLAGQRVYAVVCLWGGCNSDSQAWRIPLGEWNGDLKLDWPLSELLLNPEWLIQWDAVKQIWEV